MDILHWLESHPDVRIRIEYVAYWDSFVITMIDDELWKITSGISREFLNRMKFTITDVLDNAYEGLKEHKNNGYLPDDGSTRASTTSSSGRI